MAALAAGVSRMPSPGTERDGATPPRLAVRTLGCKVNQAETDALVGGLLAAGVTLSPENEAGVVVVNTCTVTGEADRKARKAVRRALKADGAPVVIVTGCAAAVDPAGLAALDPRVVVEPDKDALAARLEGLLLPAGTGPSETGSPAGPSLRTRAIVKVQDGCDSGCAYCVVPRARGAGRSVPAAAVLARVEILLEAGTAEVVLTGVNLGRYRDDATDLAGLVRAVAALGVRRVRLSSIEPLELSDGLVETLGSTGAVCPHLHVPLQSGSDEVLARMRRGYTVAEYSRRVEAAREAIPGLALTTDVIVGFPGESERDSEETAEVCKEHAFSKIHVFRYSARPGTPAAAMAAQVAPREREARGARLRALGDGLRRDFARARVGGTAEVLVEGRDGEGALGTTEDYLRAVVSGSDAPVGAVAKARITSAEAGVVRAEPLLP